MTGWRVGWGFDAHPLGGKPPLLVGGIAVSDSVGVVATSDGDVLAHAVADAILGACVLGDLGEHFPSSDPRWAGADSLGMLAQVVAMASDAGFSVAHLDATLIAETVRVSPHRDAIRANLAATLAIPTELVSVKATSTDGLGFAGRNEGVAAVAVVTVLN